MNHIGKLSFLGLNLSGIEISEEFREFLEKDEQGIEGLEFMLKDSSLRKRVPDEVITEYERVRRLIMERLEEIKKTIERDSDEIFRYSIERIIWEDEQQRTS